MQVLGRYTKKVEEIRFDQYNAPHFPHRQRWLSSCGESAFYALTGQCFDEVLAKKYPHVLRQKTMIRLLKQKGYTTVPLSVCTVSNGNYMHNTVNELNVVLNCQLFHRGEASWTIVHKNCYFHHDWEDKIHILEFINRPILASWIVYHPSWSVPPRNSKR